MTWCISFLHNLYFHQSLGLALSNTLRFATPQKDVKDCAERPGFYGCHYPQVPEIHLAFLRSTAVDYASGCRSTSYRVVDPSTDVTLFPDNSSTLQSGYRRPNSSAVSRCIGRCSMLTRGDDTLVRLPSLPILQTFRPSGSSREDIIGRRTQLVMVP